MPNSPDKKIFVEITNVMIYDKIVQLEEDARVDRKTGEKTLGHAIETNGQVKLLKRFSVGLWVRNNPLKFTGIVLVTFSILVSDIRHPLVSFLVSLVI